MSHLRFVDIDSWKTSVSASAGRLVRFSLPSAKLNIENAAYFQNEEFIFGVDENKFYLQFFSSIFALITTWAIFHQRHHKHQFVFRYGTSALVINFIMNFTCFLNYNLYYFLQDLVIFFSLKRDCHKRRV